MDRLYRYDLTIPYDISTCYYVEDIIDTDALAVEVLLWVIEEM